MQKKGSPVQSLHPPFSGSCNGGSSGTSRVSPLPTERQVGYNLEVLVWAQAVPTLPCLLFLPLNHPMKRATLQHFPLMSLFPLLAPPLLHPWWQISLCLVVAEMLPRTHHQWQFCLIGYVAEKFSGDALMLTYISRIWQHKAHFTMHDSGWFIFSFSSEMEMLDVLGGDPYSIFGRPLILKVMPDFFDFQSTDMTTMPTWVRFPNLPLRC